MGDSRERDVDASGQEWGSDLVADLLYAYGFEFVTFNPGASFRGIEESIVNYRDDTPEVVLTPHEGLTVSIAHGYAKATGDPAVCLLHDVVGSLHGAMALYNAYCDRVPLLAIAGNGPLRKSQRRPWIDWIHTALAQGEVVADCVKWSDQPAHVDGVTDSVLRALRIADLPPRGPVYLTIDQDIQESRLESPIEPPPLDENVGNTGIPPDAAALGRAADALLAAESPAIVVELAGDTRAGFESLVELAELLGAPVVDARKRRLNFPTTHPLYLEDDSMLARADVLLALGVESLGYALTHNVRRSDEAPPVDVEETFVIDVGLQDLGASSRIPDYYAHPGADLPILAEPGKATPLLAEAIREGPGYTEAYRADVRERTAAVSAEHDDQVARWEREAADHWEDVPIALPRLAAELWEVVRDDEWVSVGSSLRGWTHRLWELDAFDDATGNVYQGGGIGCGIGAAIGAALAYRDTERLPVNLQPDGDLFFYPNALWVLGHHQVPMLTVVHNNRSYHNSTAHRMRLAEFRGRDASHERALVGTGLVDPVPDYAAIAEAVGVNGFGPVEDPDGLAAALEPAWEAVRRGEPALVDVVCQPR